MSKYLNFTLGLILCSFAAVAAQNVGGAVVGTVKHIDAATKTIVVKMADGTERTFHFAEHTSVHGTKEAVKGSKEPLNGLKGGSEVVVHYTRRGSEDTAEEIDHIGKDGLKVGEGTVKKIDRGGKTLTVTTADGSEETYRLTDRAARAAGEDIGKGTEKSAKVTIYYTEEGGHKVARFFKKAF
jgi:hypothetical protein